MLAHAYNCCTRDSEVGDHHEFKASLDKKQDPVQKQHRTLSLCFSFYSWWDFTIHVNLGNEKNVAVCIRTSASTLKINIIYKIIDFTIVLVEQF